MYSKAAFWVVLAVVATSGTLELAAGEESPVRRYSSFLGGFGSDRCRAVARDGDGNVYLAGSTDSADFPVPEGSDPVEIQGGTDAVVVKLSPELDEVRATRLLGGIGDDIAMDMAVTAAGKVVITGHATAHFPTTDSGIQTENAGQRDFFVAVLEREALEVEYATLLVSRLR